ncbi:MAG: uncharacterized protein K0S79_1205 [Nitrospira sp.]|nr:uncharacterized protein [Nitrospira sp.]
MKRCFAALAIWMIVLYAALAIGAANCLVLHADLPTAHHHSHSHVAHSPLCAWACQVSPSVAVAAAVPVVAVSLPVVLVRSADSTSRATFFDSGSLSRGPPR